MPMTATIPMAIFANIDMLLLYRTRDRDSTVLVFEPVSSELETPELQGLIELAGHKGAQEVGKV
jgi:hypothetical protein